MPAGKKKCHMAGTVVLHPHYAHLTATAKALRDALSRIR
jgi:hypothetical protein